MNKKRYLELLAPVLELVAAKGEDYNTGVALHDYFPFGHKSYIQMVHLKALRLVAIADNEEPNFDSVKDTVMDLINYAVFYLDYLNEHV